MEREVKWRKPVLDKYGDAVRTSKCGRYRVLTRRMASGRNGYWNARAYEVIRIASNARIGSLNDTLSEALDTAEYDNNPNWEPS